LGEAAAHGDISVVRSLTGSSSSCGSYTYLRYLHIMHFVDGVPDRGIPLYHWTKRDHPTSTVTEGDNIALAGCDKEHQSCKTPTPERKLGHGVCHVAPLQGCASSPELIDAEVQDKYSSFAH
jgi:hypothetical protein